MPEQRDVVICWNFASVPADVQARFQRPVAFITLPTPPKRGYRDQIAGFGDKPIRKLVRDKLGTSVQPGRVALLGFSESCQGVRGLLASKDGGLVDTAVAIDGIHAGFVGEPNKDRSNVQIAALAPWIAMASAAANGMPISSNAPTGRRHCIITHSSIGDQLYPPYKFASTTRTAALILYYAIGELPEEWQELPPGTYDVDEVPPYVGRAGTLPGGVSYPQVIYSHSPDKYYVVKEGLAVIGYNNLDPTGVNDHKYQAQRVLPRVLNKLLVDRWNDEDPNKGVCLGTVAGVGAPECEQQVNPRGVTIPKQDWESAEDFSLDWKRWASGVGGGTGTVPLPPDGTPPTPTSPPGEQGPSAASQALSFALGLGAGYLGVKAVQAVRRA